MQIRRGSYIHSPDWIKNKKATINAINNKDKRCCQYAVTVVLNREEKGKHAERTTKYKWEVINFPSEKDDWKTFEKNNVTISFNVLYAKKENIYPASVSKIIEILLMIPNREKRKAKSEGRQHYLAVKKLSALLRGVTSKYYGDYCMNCLHSFETKTNLNRIKEYVKINIFVAL